MLSSQSLLYVLNLFQQCAYQNGEKHLGNGHFVKGEACITCLRQFMKRFARLTLGFSKKLENLEAATALHIATYDFCRVHRTLKCTPAMAAGIVQELWGFDRLYDEVMALAGKDAMRLRSDRLLKALMKK